MGQDEMNDQPEQPSEQGVQEVGVQAELRLVAPDYSDVPLLYANFIQGTISPHDLTLHFGWFATPPLQAPPTGPVDVPVRPLAVLSIPVSLIRPVIRVLESQAAAYEAGTGTPLPSEPSAQVQGGST